MQYWGMTSTYMYSEIYLSSVAFRASVHDFKGMQSKNYPAETTLTVWARFTRKVTSLLP